ncbi:hypothetical protein F4805DRAFT_442063 [Annulohypoxylon moriforme]|nr:hypothetical protein F4805DRAFT_442063 [Annulohypoxylon moriforme]
MSIHINNKDEQNYDSNQIRFERSNRHTSEPLGSLPIQIAEKVETATATGELARSNTPPPELEERDTSIGGKVPAVPHSSHGMDSSITSIGSIDDSMDDDLLSISDSSTEDVRHMGPDDRIYSEITALVRDLAERHKTAATDGQLVNGSRSCATTSPEDQPANTPTRLPTKRGRPQKNNENSDDEEPSVPPPKREKQNKEKDLAKYLACPFAKNDPIKHYTCFSRRLSRIRDVKQHLARKHTPEFYCSRCSVIFPDQNSLQEHIGNAAGLFCTPSSLLDGISQYQRSQLSRKSNSKLSEEKQWFSMWDIIFPGHERPESAYMDLGFSGDFRSFKEYSHRRAVAAVVDWVTD